MFIRVSNFLMCLNRSVNSDLCLSNYVCMFVKCAVNINCATVKSACPVYELQSKLELFPDHK